ncbi:MAG: alpha/beta hydrolase-fold protein [Lachnospiraceae bacterium]|jgi:predicted alpha/beta superfamily hydrolase
MGIRKIEMDNMIIKVYPAEGEDLPVIYSCQYMECGKLLLDQCSRIGCPPFRLVTISRISWDEYLSPWPSDPVVTKEDHFTGQSPEFLQWLLQKAVPWAEKKMDPKPSRSYLSGYSMAGLFSLWSAYQTDFFDGYVCASGSLWYPDFLSFAKEHDLAKTPEGIYLSLGDQESAAANPALQQTESVYRALDEYYAQKGIPHIFELNPGNHYQDTALREAKGFRWLLQGR